ncbi:glycosyltransferase family 2 protein [Natronosporangium hydrolyticum]|uniref:glycosyltransferase family 2 protein n=1 Tax=Natronosporangium hydrolyticum TaxID=2811111 RepID=UPI001EFA1461|nr:glycosyltransferase family A protein [Natronosporangium hydrolyticum]
MNSSPDAPLVSVVVPNYNYAETLGPCLQAVQAQTYPRLEVIVADDCSTDRSVSIARAAGARVVSTRENSGQAVTRNLGAAHARGEFLFFVDSDLILDPEAVANAVSLLRSDPTIGAVCGVNDPEPLIPDRKIKEYRALQYHYWSLPDGDVPVLFSAMFAIRAATFAELGPFDPRLRWSEEFEYGHRITRRYRIFITTAVRGRHDPDATLGGMLRKLFHRGRVRVPLYAQVRQFASGFETGPRAMASVVALLGVVALALPAALGAVWLVVPAALLAGSVVADLGMYRFVAARRGVWFLGYYTAMHFLVNITIAAAVATGAGQWLVSRRFRRLYDDCPKPAPHPTNSSRLQEA